LIKAFVTTALLALGLFVAPALSQEQLAALPDVVDARVSTTPERARLIIDLSAKTEFAIVSLTEPNRIAIDVRAANLKFTTPPTPAGQGIVASYIVEMAETGRARTMLTLNSPAQVQQAYVLDAFDDQPARLVVDLIPDSPENFADRAAQDLAASQRAAGIDPAVAPDAAAPDAMATVTQPTEPGASNVASGTRPLVVIDPGHGGIDNGASASSGVHEKDIVLAFALKLQDLLVESGRFDVALTREDDTFLTLEQRVTLARENKADLFISIHADSFQQAEISGASIYTRDEKATDVLDKVLADNENKRDIVAGFVLPEMDAAVVDILVDLMRRQMRQQSYVAAQAIVHQLEPSVTLRKFPVRQANFFVLQAPDVPSILLELGFLSNADDIANLMKSDWQARVSEALARGIASYFDGVAAQEGGVSVAQQNATTTP
jgi:N-acetylmuramoyl-L-alanine amidase